jgi:two-component system, response regulator
MAYFAGGRQKKDDVRADPARVGQKELANNIHVARGGEEALEFLFCNGLCRAFLRAPVEADFAGPEAAQRDRMEVVKWLKGDLHAKTIPVVILTSSQEERDLINGYGLGANSYIQKPVDFDQFRDTVKNVELYWL